MPLIAVSSSNGRTNQHTYINSGCVVGATVTAESNVVALQLVNGTTLNLNAPSLERAHSMSKMFDNPNNPAAIEFTIQHTADADADAEGKAVADEVIASIMATFNGKREGKEGGASNKKRCCFAAAKPSKEMLSTTMYIHPNEIFIMFREPTSSNAPSLSLILKLLSGKTLTTTPYPSEEALQAAIEMVSASSASS